MTPLKVHVRRVALAAAPLIVTAVVCAFVLALWPLAMKLLSGKPFYWFVRAQPLPILVIPFLICLGVCWLLPMHWRPAFARSTLIVFLLVAGYFGYRDYLRLAPWMEQHGQSFASALAYVDHIIAGSMIAGLLACAGTMRLSIVVPDPFKRAKSNAPYGDAAFMDMDVAAKIHPEDGSIVVGERYRVDLDVVHGVGFDPRDRSTWGKGGTVPLLTNDLSRGSGHTHWFAGSGGFKTTATSIPTCLTYAGPVVGLDPSNELVPIVREYRQSRLGRRVHVLDPAFPVGFDATGWIKTSKRPQQDCATLALLLRAESARISTGTDNFFQDSAHNLLTGLLSHVLLSKDYKGERNLRGLRKLITTPEKTLQELLQKIYNEATSDFVKETLGVFINMTEQTFSGVYTTAGKDTQWLSFPEYASLVCGEAFEAGDLARGEIDVFLNLPLNTMQTYSGIARVIIGSLINAMFQAEGKHARRVLFLLDEVNQLGRMRTLEIARDVGRKHGIALMMLWQSIGQLEANYGREGQTVWLDNASFISFAAVNDRRSAEEISRRCGQITIEVEGSSRSFGMWGSNASSRMSRSVSYQKRPLILEHEVMQNVRTDEQIIFMLNQPPLRCGRAIYFRRPEMNAVVGQNRFAR
ncbi:MAG TPA: Ti-type conjugative transfer system protein TraG [Sphingomicrobium sp.]|nr:Ti-type conjugative transfer system protein TraG [Sphingomicrobium sp.]